MIKIISVFLYFFIFFNIKFLLSQCYSEYSITVNHTTCGLNNGSIIIEYIDPCEQFEIIQPSCISVYNNTCQDCPITWDHINSVYTIGEACDHINSINTYCNGVFPNNYHYFNDYLKVSPGNQVTVVAQCASILTGCTSQYIQGFSLWIDWNANGIFEQNELIGSHAPTFMPVTWAVTIPNVPDGIYTMRIRCAWATIPNDPCSVYGYGETEDYPICVKNNILNDFSLYHDGQYIGSGNLFENLEAGDYILINGNEIIQITINPSEQISYTYNIHDVSCYGFNDGYIEINGDVNTTWLQPIQFNGNYIDNLYAGEYVALISNDECSEIVNFTINQPEPFNVAVLYNDLYCYDSTFVSFIPFGGTPPYTLPNISYIGEGNHTFYSYDSNGCVWINNITINNYKIPENFIFEIIQPKCYGDSAHIIFDGMGLWSIFNGDIHPEPGQHVYTFIDTNGCIINKNVYINETEKPYININITHPLCSYDMGVVSINNSVYKLQPGTHTISYEYESGCYFDTTITINNPPDFYFINNYEYKEGYLALHDVLNIDIVSESNYLYYIDCFSCYIIDNNLYFDYLNQKIKLIAISEFGCQIEKIIEVVGLRGPWYPNAITLNDDGLNDCFSIIDVGVKKFKLYVWNRWGEKIWQTDNIYECWIPSDKQDLYIWNASIEYIDGLYKNIYGTVLVIK